MAFDSNGNYSPPDAPTRFVHVATKDGTVPVGHNPGMGHEAAIKAGQVTQIKTMGYTNVASAGVMHLLGGAWIEHATAQVGDVISASELSAAVALATKRQAAVKAFQEQERIDGPARAAKAAKDAQDAADAALEAKIDARIKAALAVAKSAK